MQKFTLFILFSLSCFVAWAQADTTLLDTSYQYKKVMIIPFEEDMYICEIQSQLGSNSGMNTAQIKRTFRYGIASALQNQFLYLYSTTSLIHLVQDSLKDLYRVYGSIARTYDLVPEEPKEEPKGALGPVLKKLDFKANKKEGKEEKTHIENGQIISKQTSAPRFMNVAIKDPALLPYLNQKYGTDLFVFLNEMDIVNDLSDPYKVAENNYDRILKFHYTVYNHKGQILNKGIISTPFPSTENSVNGIIKVYFPLIAKQLATKLPQPKVLKVQEVNSADSKIMVEEK